jgi:hypothetical protein
MLAKGKGNMHDGGVKASARTGQGGATMRHAIGTSILVLTACVCLATLPVRAETGDDIGAIRQQLTRDARPVEIQGTWYPPARPPEQGACPLVVVMASEDFPASPKDYWVRTPWRIGCGTVVLRAEDNRWDNVRSIQVMREVARCPKAIPADPDRLVLVADNETGLLAMRVMDGYADRIAGAVFLSVLPLQMNPDGPSLWTPRKELWAIPLWVVAGTRPDEAGPILEKWRVLSASAPPNASVTVDARIGRGRGHLLPGEAFDDWLGTLAAGQRPQPGPDPQADAERKQFSPLADGLREAVENTPAAPAGQEYLKEEGPFRLRLVAPKDWLRDEEGERPYNPRGTTIDSQGRSLPGVKNPYAELYVTPKPRGPFFARLCAARWSRTGAELLDDYTRRLRVKGYLPVILHRWQTGPWTCQVATVQMIWKNDWHRWLVLSAARDASAENPASPLVMVMDATDQPDLDAMAAGLNRLIADARVDALVKSAPAPQPLE